MDDVTAGVMDLSLFSPLLIVLYFSSFSRKSGSSLNTSVRHTNKHLDLLEHECVQLIPVIHWL